MCLILRPKSTSSGRPEDSGDGWDVFVPTLVNCGCSTRSGSSGDNGQVRTLAKIGYDYSPQLRTVRFRGTMDNWSINPIIAADNSVDKMKFIIFNIDTTASLYCLLKPQNGDTVLECHVRGEISGPLELTPSVRDSIRTGEEFSRVTSRNGQRISLTAIATQEEIIEKHVIIPKRILSEEK